MQVPGPIRDFLRRRGIAIKHYEFTIPARRQALFAAHGVDLLVDVGANVGQYATQARAAGYSGKILSVEPLAEAYEELRGATSSDPDWTCVRTALGSHSGEINLHVSVGSIFSSALHVRDEVVRVDRHARSTRDEVVPLTTLDDLLDGADASELGVKIDVQGFERDVLEGAAQTLQRARILEMELSPTPIYQGQMLLMEALDRMSDAGLVLSLVENLLRDPASGRSLQFNGIFVRPSPDKAKCS